MKKRVTIMTHHKPSLTGDADVDMLISPDVIYLNTHGTTQLRHRDRKSLLTPKEGVF